MEPDNPLFYLQSTINKEKNSEWKIVEEDFNERVFDLKQEFRREGEEFFAAHWKHFK